MYKYKAQAGDTEIDELKGKITELEDKLTSARKQIKKLEQKLSFRNKLLTKSCNKNEVTLVFETQNQAQDFMVL